MAIISISFDTKEKTMSVTKDGESIENVVGAYLGCGYGQDGNKYRCELMTATKDEENSIRTFTTIVASELAGEDLSDAEPSEVEGFVIASRDTDLQRDINKYFAPNAR